MVLFCFLLDQYDDMVSVQTARARSISLVRPMITRGLAPGRLIFSPKIRANMQTLIDWRCKWTNWMLIKLTGSSRFYPANLAVKANLLNAPLRSRPDSRLHYIDIRHCDAMPDDEDLSQFIDQHPAVTIIADLWHYISWHRRVAVLVTPHLMHVYWSDPPVTFHLSHFSSTQTLLP